MWLSLGITTRKLFTSWLVYSGIAIAIDWVVLQVLKVPVLQRAGQGKGEVSAGTVVDTGSVERRKRNYERHSFPVGDSSTTPTSSSAMCTVGAGFGLGLGGAAGFAGGAVCALLLQLEPKLELEQAEV